MSSAVVVPVIRKHGVPPWLWILGLIAIGVVIWLAATGIGAPNRSPVSPSFVGEILEIHDGGVLIEPAADDPIRSSGDRVWVGTTNLPDIGAIVGNPVVVYFDGNVMESYPLQVHASDWALITE